MAKFNRRQALQGMGATLGLLSLRGYQAHAAAVVHFTHGVASGDPLSDRVILWSRVVPGNGQVGSLTALWQIAEDSGFTQIVSSGRVDTSAQQDYTLKVDATGLQPGAEYFYRFVVDNLASPVGQTRTLPVGEVKQFKIGLASCSNYPQGYFNAYRDMAGANLDLVLHLGDYIYEYPEGGYANPEALEKLGRHVKPEHEILSLEDYRMRYGLYRTDADLQLLHARHPFICVWDDHELMNDTWRMGAQNHNPGEGDFQVRINNARRAYHEWMPIRTPQSGDTSPIYRNFQIGKLADLFMLDTRYHGRDQGFDYQRDVVPKMLAFDVRDSEHPILVNKFAAQKLSAEEVEWLPAPFDFTGGQPQPVLDYTKVKSVDPDAMPQGWHFLPDGAAFKAGPLADERRTILGYDQEAWLTQRLKTAAKRGSTWQILGQQVLMGKVGIPVFEPEAFDVEALAPRTARFVRTMQVLETEGLPFNLDAWDGYPACRNRVMEGLQKYAKNPVVVAGDTHNAWAFDLTDDSNRPVGVEVGTPGITSPGMESFLPVPMQVLEAAFGAASPELVDLDAKHRGWAELTFTPESMTNQWHFVDTILDRNYQVIHGKPLTCLVDAKRFSAT